MYNALGVVAQLVRASACHAEGRGFEPRQSRQYLPQFPAVFLLFVLWQISACAQGCGETLNFQRLLRCA